MKLLADDVNSVFGTVSPPPELKNLTSQGGAAGLSLFLTNLITIIYAFAALAFLFMLIIGAFQWIVSGGDKEALSKAKGRISHAIIGIILLALVFVIANILGQLTGFEFFKGQNIGGVNQGKLNKIQDQISDPRDRR